jgi:hypothetical protein
MFKRNRTSSKYIYYALKLYFSGLSLRKTSEHLSPFIKRNHVSIWNWIQQYKPSKIISQKRKKVLSKQISKYELPVDNNNVIKKSEQDEPVLGRENLHNYIRKNDGRIHYIDD